MTSDRANGIDGDLVETLIRTAGRRTEPPADAYRTVFAAAEATWQRKVKRRRYWRAGAGIAATFVLLAVATALLRSMHPETTTLEVARVDRLGGIVEARLAGAGDWMPLTDAGSPLRAGTRLRTGPSGRANLRLDGGVSLRIATLTELELRAPDAVRLRRGAVYADTGSGNSRGIGIDTPVGVARDLGTQFEVRYANDVLRLRVREGRVSLQREAGDVTAAAGEQLTIDVAGNIARRSIGRDGSEWAWAETMAPVPDFNDQPATALLEWVSHETGRPLRYADPEAERKAATVILHGPIGSLAPLEALRVMLATTDLTYEILPDGTIEVRSH
jgi:ferric-dicitrate binding protein FerR (iron transport regulator)